MKYMLEIKQLEQMKSNPWLTDREKRVFNLYYVRGWNIEEVAAEIDRNRSTVNRILKSVRLKNLRIYEP